ncbi:hypothetical protein M0804_007860 [Polistes exclamans]|nr:hypothetical protein M0804_007860 [Polistes exclamans]
MTVIPSTLTVLTFLITSLSLSQAIGVILNEDVSNDSSDDIYVFLAEAVSCFKMFSLVINRNNIVNLISSLTEEPYKPSNEVETRIQTKFNELSRFNTHSYAFLISLSVSNFLFSSLVSDFKERQLTFRVWLPFDAYMTPLVYYLTYVHQLLSLTLGAIIHVALDTLICNLLITICCQIKLLENRLTKITNERTNILKLCIRHHESIYKYAASVNKTFKFAIFMQFLATFTMTVLSICGCLIPPSWSISFFKRLVYNLYTIFVALLISSLSLSQAIAVILNGNNSNDSSDDIYIFLAEAISCFKMLSLLINRNNIVNLISSLTQEPYKPSNDVETRIQIKFDNWSSIPLMDCVKRSQLKHRSNFGLNFVVVYGV